MTLIKFKKDQELSCRSIGDYDCIFRAKVISRTAKFATIKVEGYREPKRVKIHVTENSEFIYPLGQYSMSPIMRAG